MITYQFKVGNYIQNLWAEINESESMELFNGITEAINTLLGALAAFSIQFVRLDWKKHGEWALGIHTWHSKVYQNKILVKNVNISAFISIIDFGLLLALSFTSRLVVAYVYYVVFNILYQTMITIATWVNSWRINFMITYDFKLSAIMSPKIFRPSIMALYLVPILFWLYFSKPGSHLRSLTDVAFPLEFEIRYLFLHSY